jgi:hypothetical protein
MHGAIFMGMDVNRRRFQTRLPVPTAPATSFSSPGAVGKILIAGAAEVIRGAGKAKPRGKGEKIPRYALRSAAPRDDPQFGRALVRANVNPGADMAHRRPPPQDGSEIPSYHVPIAPSR